MTLLKKLPGEHHLHLEKQFIYKNFFFVKKNNRNIRIKVDDIQWVKADGSSIKITYSTGSVITFANLRSFEKQIQHPNLVRVHRSYMVNLININAFDDQYLYILHNNMEKKVPLGRTYRKAVLKPFNQLKAD